MFKVGDIVTIKNEDKYDLWIVECFGQKLKWRVMMSKIKKVIHICENQGSFQCELNDRIQKLQDEGMVVEIQYGNPIESKYNTNIKYNAILICREDPNNYLSMIKYTQEELDWVKDWGKDCAND